MKRLLHFDVIKGIAIFLVVMGHVLTMCIRDIDQAFSFKLIGETHMPLFFFITGYFTYKTTRDGAHSFVTPNLWGRFRQLIIPMLVAGGLWTLYFPHSGLQSPMRVDLDGVLHDVWKVGYWFPLVLFEIIVIYAALALLLRHVKGFVALACTMILACVAVDVIVEEVCSADLGNMLSLPLVAQFLPAVLMGALARRYNEGFKRLISNSWCTFAAILIGGVALYVKVYSWEFGWMTTLPYMKYVVVSVWHFCIAIVVFAVVVPWCERSIERPTRAIGMWSLLGRESLGIYLLHYFLLFPLPMLQEPFRSMGLGFVPTLTVAAAIAAVIVTMTLGLIMIIRVSKPLSTLLMGR